MGARDEQLVSPLRPALGEAEWYKRLMPGVYHRLATVVVGEVSIPAALAKEVLETRNGLNRPLALVHLLQLSRSMKNGQWVLTGETIVFDEHGQLLDGQHRLEGCARSGVTITAIVVIGIRREVFRVLGQGKRRAARQVMAMMDIPHAQLAASASSALYRFINYGNVLNQGPREPTIDEILAAYHDHPELSQSIALVAGAGRDLIFPRPGFLAVYHYIFSRIDKPKADLMARSIINVRAPDEPEWHACHLLIHRLAVDARKPVKPTARYVAALTVKAWNALYLGENLRVLKWAEDIEDFPEVEGWKTLSADHAEDGQ